MVTDNRRHEALADKGLECSEPMRARRQTDRLAATSICVAVIADEGENADSDEPDEGKFGNFFGRGAKQTPLLRSW